MSLVSQRGQGPLGPRWTRFLVKIPRGPRKAEGQPNMYSNELCGPEHVAGRFAARGADTASQNDPKIAQNSPKTAQNGPKTAQDGPKTTPRRARTAPGRPQNSPGRPQDGPKTRGGKGGRRDQRSLRAGGPGSRGSGGPKAPRCLPKFGNRV